MICPRCGQDCRTLADYSHHGFQIHGLLAAQAAAEWERAQTAAPPVSRRQTPRGVTVTPPQRKESAMGRATLPPPPRRCTACQALGHRRPQCPTREAGAAGAARCSYCKRRSGHAPACPREATTTTGTATATPAAAPKAAPTLPPVSLSEARVRLVGRIETLRVELSNFEGALRVLDDLGRP